MDYNATDSAQTAGASIWAPLMRLDVLAAASLVTTYAWNARRGIGPAGWQADDAWVVTAAGQADSLGETINLGFTHPGFNVLIRLLSRSPTDAVAFQALPVLGAIASLIVLFAVMKHAIKSTVVAWAVLVPFASSWLLFRYSMSVKPYTLEILGFAVALFLLQRWRTVSNQQLVLWVGAIAPLAVLDFRLSFISAVAGFGMYWAGRMHWRQLGLLAAAHAAILGPLLLFVQSRFNSDTLGRWWQSRAGVYTEDGQATIVALWQQLHRVTRVIFNGPDVIGWLLVALVILGAIDGVLERKAAETAAAAGLVLAIGLSLLQLSPFGPQQLGNQRIDLWLAPALLLLTVNGGLLVARWAQVEKLGRLASGRSLAGSMPVVVIAAAAMVLAPAVVDVTGSDHVYQWDGLAENFTFAQFQLETSDGSLLVGPNHNGVALQLAAHDPESVVDVVHFPGNMRGIQLETSPPMVRVATFVEAPALGDADRVVALRLEDSTRPSFRAVMRDAGFVRTNYPRFPLVEVWDRVE